MTKNGKEKLILLTGIKRLQKELKHSDIVDYIDITIRLNNLYQCLTELCWEEIDRRRTKLDDKLEYKTRFTRDLLT